MENKNGMNPLSEILHNSGIKKEISRTSTGHNHQTPEDVCPICGGMGYVTRDVPVGHPDFGKAFPCVCQRENIAKRRMRRIQQISNLKAYHEMTFANFDIDREMLSDRQGSVLSYAKESAMHYAADPQGWMVFQGNYGTGKTHLAAAIGNYLIANEYEDVIFLTVPDLLDHLRTTYHPKSEIRYDELFDRLRNAAVLILDDLGTESPTAWAGEKLFQLLNYRYVHHLPTVVTTNHRLEDMDGRIASRLADRDTVLLMAMRAPDHRKARQGEITKSDNPLNDMRLYHDMTFDNFNWANVKNARQIRRIVEAYRDQQPRLNGWLLILGNHGVGKTHLAASLVHYRQRMFGDDIAFTNTSLLNDLLRKSLNGGNEQLEQQMKAFFDARVLVLDDLNNKAGSAWLNEKLFQIVDYRYLLRKPTIITANEKDLSQLDDRIESRLKDRRLVAYALIDAEHYPSLRNHRNVLGIDDL